MPPERAPRRFARALGVATGIAFVALPALARDPELAAPEGFVVQRLEFTDGEILRPEAWSYEEQRGPNGALWTFAKERRPDGTYLTGMRIQLFVVEGGSAKTPAQIADELFAGFEAAADEVLSTCGPVVGDQFTNRCIETIQRMPGLNAEEPFRLVYGLWWSNHALVVSTFGAPAGEWGDVEAIYARMANFVMFGPAFGKRVEAEALAEGDALSADDPHAGAPLPIEKGASAP